MTMEQLIEAIRKNCAEARDIILSHAGDLECEPRMTTMSVCLESLEDAADECERTIQDRCAPKKILVAIDDDVKVQHLLDEAIEFARLSSGKISIVHAVDTRPLVMPQVDTPELLDRHMLLESRREMLRSVMNRIPVEVRGEMLLAEGLASEQIIAVAAKTNADFLVIGTHGRGRVGRLLLGSVAEAVVRQAPCAVLTINPACERRASMPRPDSAVGKANTCAT